MNAFIKTLIVAKHLCFLSAYAVYYVSICKLLTNCCCYYLTVLRYKYVSKLNFTCPHLLSSYWCSKENFTTILLNNLSHAVLSMWQCYVCLFALLVFFLFLILLYTQLCSALTLNSVLRDHHLWKPMKC